MNRPDLKDSIALGKAKPRLPSVSNRQLYTGYRVVVYRFNAKGLYLTDLDGMGGVAPFSTNESYPSNLLSVSNLLSIDPSSKDYTRITDYFAKSDNYLKIYNALYSKLNGDVTRSNIETTSDANKIKSMYKDNNLVEEIDITPIVQAANINLDLEGVNTCIVECLDPSLADFYKTEINKIYSANDWMSVVYPNMKFEELLKTIKGFKFIEFDLIRVFAYSSLTESLSSKIKNTLSTLGVSTANRGDIKKIIGEYCLPTVFTGFVHGISNTNSVGSVSGVAAQCVGVSRILSQTSAVVDQALANQIVMKKPQETGNINNMVVNIQPTANIFSGKSAQDVFAKIMKDVFYSKDYANTDNTVVAGLPSLESLTAQTTNLVSSEKKIIPLFPNIVALHYLKKKFSELMFYCDDNIVGTQYEVNKSDGQATEVGYRDFANILKPYMYLLKSTFEMFESTYMSPYEVLESIRANCYMEVFENRDGSFRFRFPRYNSSTLDAVIPFDEIMSIAMNRSDSNNFSVIQTRFMASIIGSFKQLPCDVFVDTLSMLRFGFRMSSVIENPNAISATFVKYLGRFIKYYSVLRESRSATINLAVGDPSISVGQMVGFRYGYPSEISHGSGEQSVAPVDVSNSTGEYVGYVTNISERVGVDAGYTQTLTLKFIRSAVISLLDKESARIEGGLKTPQIILNESAKDFSDYATYALEGLFQDGSPHISVSAGLVADTSIPLVMSALDSDYVQASFSYIESSLDLAKSYADRPGVIDDEIRVAQSISGNMKIKPEPLTTKQLNEKISDSTKRIDAYYRDIGIMIHMKATLNGVNEAIDQVAKNGKDYIGKDFSIVDSVINNSINDNFRKAGSEVNVGVKVNGNIISKPIAISNGTYGYHSDNVYSIGDQYANNGSGIVFGFKERIKVLVNTPIGDRRVTLTFSSLLGPDTITENTNTEKSWWATMNELHANIEQSNREKDFRIKESEAAIVSLSGEIEAYKYAIASRGN